MSPIRLLFTLALSTLLFPACNSCPDGFYGNNCSSALNERFDGEFTLNDTECERPDLAGHPILLLPSSNDPSIFTIGGVYGTDFTQQVTCEVNESSRLVYNIPVQAFALDSQSTHYTIIGGGSLRRNENRILVDVVIMDTLNEEVFNSCTLLYER